VRRVVAAIDCGRFVSPDTVEAQVEGGVMPEALARAERPRRTGEPLPSKGDAMASDGEGE